MKGIFRKALTMPKHERIIRIIEISVKGENASLSETIELAAMQAVRELNGEIEEVKQERNYHEL